MRVAELGISERWRFCRILLGLDHQPAAVMYCRQSREELAKIDAAVARHGKDAVENAIEKTRIGRANPGEHVAPHILAMGMVDARPVAPRQLLGKLTQAAAKIAPI